MTRSAFEVAADLFDPQPSIYEKDPVRWAHDKGIFLYSKQNDILVSLVIDDTAVHSCHTSGKSFDAAVAVAWWLDSHPPGTAFVVTSAPTGDQVKAILWREIGRIHKLYDLPGRVNLTEWYIGGELVAFGRKPNDYEPTAFHGIHAIHVLVVLDEGSGIPKALMDAASTLTSNDGSRTLIIGNPDDPSSHFAKLCKPGSGWRVIHISAQDTPNFTGEPVPPEVAAAMLSKSWVEKKKLEWGEDSALYISKVLGLFPKDSEFGIIPASAIAKCRRLELEEGPVELGVDVGAGGDQSVIRERKGMVAGEVWRSRHGDPEKLQDEIISAILQTQATKVKIDSNGIGWGICGWVRKELRTAGVECAVLPVNVGEGSQFPKRYVNLRAEMWWEIGRELSRHELWDLRAIDDECAVELETPKYLIKTGGRIQVEDKDEVKKRLGRSPDDADALLLAFYDPPVKPPMESGAAKVLAKGSVHV